MKYTLELEDYIGKRTEWRDNRGEPGQHRVEVDVAMQRYRLTVKKTVLLLRPSKTSEMYADLYVKYLKAQKKYFKNQDYERDEKLKYRYLGRAYELNNLSHLNLDRDFMLRPMIKTNDSVGDPVRDALKRIFPNREKI